MWQTPAQSVNSHRHQTLLAMLVLAMIAGSKQIETSQIHGALDGGSKGRSSSSNSNGFGHVATNNVIDDNTQCPSFTDNSACPCYKFEDGE